MMPLGQSLKAVRPSFTFLLITVVAAGGAIFLWFATPGSPRANIGSLLFVLAGWVVTLCLHEFAHAFTAHSFGDRDVALRGYLTLNPIKYVSPGLSIILPIIFLLIGGIGLPGGAVWLQTQQMSKKQQSLVAFAGPFANFFCGGVLLAVFNLCATSAHAALWFAVAFLAFLQIMAGVLNLIPIPGLDGYSVIEPHLSYAARRRFEQLRPVGFLIVFVLLMVPFIGGYFFQFIYWICGAAGLDPYAIFLGQRQTVFWRSLL